MIEKAILTEWLKSEHPELSWKRTPGDTPDTGLDSLFLNRSEGYEIRDLIYNYYQHCKLEFKESNFKITFKKIMKFEAGKKVKREAFLQYLIDNNDNCKK